MFVLWGEKGELSGKGGARQEGHGRVGSADPFQKLLAPHSRTVCVRMLSISCGARGESREFVVVDFLDA
jgi:hypothetical protein